MEFKEFESFVEGIQSNCVVRVRIADNMLEAEDWGVAELIIEDDLVVSQRQIQEGVYQIPEMVGWNTQQLSEWSQWDDTGHPVENYHEIAIGNNLPSKAPVSEIINAVKTEWESLEELLGAIDEPQCGKRMVKSHLKGVSDNLRALIDYYQSTHTSPERR